jgi:hypothetical protein
VKVQGWVEMKMRAGLAWLSEQISGKKRLETGLMGATSRERMCRCMQGGPHPSSWAWRAQQAGHIHSLGDVLAARRLIDQPSV